MSSYGTRASRQGYDAIGGADQEMLFETNSPALKIQASGSTPIPTPDGSTLIYNYPAGMSYVPVYWGFIVNAPASMVIQTGWSQFLKASSTSLYWNPSSQSTGQAAFTLYWYVFRVPLLQSFGPVSVLKSPTTKGTVQTQYGVVVSKPTKDALSSVDMADKRNAVMHSNTRSPLIHMTGSQTFTGGASVAITHNLGYTPMYFIYVDVGNTGNYQPVFTADDAVVSSTNTQITVTLFTAAGTLGYVVLKDPLYAAGE